MQSYFAELNRVLGWAHSPPTAVDASVTIRKFFGCLKKIARAAGSIRAAAREANLTLPEGGNAISLWDAVVASGRVPEFAEKVRQLYGMSTSVRVIAHTQRVNTIDPRFAKGYRIIVYATIQYEGTFLDTRRIDGIPYADLMAELPKVGSQIRLQVESFMKDSFEGFTDVQMDQVIEELGKMPVSDLKNDDRWETIVTKKITAPCTFLVATWWRARQQS